MKSPAEYLIKRGYLSPQFEKRFKNLSDTNLIKMLESTVAQERTAAARLLQHKKNILSIHSLCQALENERSLYSKIAISKALGSMGVKPLSFLIGMLGKIGRNQYKQTPAKLFKKTNYPLPRDIVARTITKIGPVALPALEKILLKGELSQIYEAIDSIGYISFYSNEHRSLKYLFLCLKQNKDNNLLIWKIVRALEAFPLPKSEKFLQSVVATSKNRILILEATRSLKQISKNRGDY